MRLNLTRKVHLLIVVAALSAACLNLFLNRVSADGSAQAKSAAVNFDREIRPILSVS